MKCFLNILDIDDKINNETIIKYVKYFANFNLNKTDNGKIFHYINKNNNFTITIFKEWICTKELLKYDYFEINASKIIDIFKFSNYNIFIYVNFNYEHMFNIYNSKSKKFLLNSKNILKNSDYYLKLTNNYTKEIKNYLSKILIAKIIENDISIFDKNNFIFNDICKNFTIQNIDMPMKERRKILFLGYIAKEIICNDINCDIESINFSYFIGKCNCRVKYNKNNLFIKKELNNSIAYQEYVRFINSKSKINSFINLKCAKESFNLKNLKNNVNFIISMIFIFIYLILLIAYFITSKNNKSNKEIKLNPPKVDKFYITDDFEEEDKEGKKDNENENKNEESKKQIDNKKVEIETPNKKSYIILSDNIIGKRNKKQIHKHSIKNIKNNRIIIPQITNNHKNNNYNLKSEENNLKSEQQVIQFKKKSIVIRLIILQKII